MWTTTFKISFSRPTCRGSTTSSRSPRRPIPLRKGGFSSDSRSSCWNLGWWLSSLKKTTVRLQGLTAYLSSSLISPKGSPRACTMSTTQTSSNQWCTTSEKPLERPLWFPTSWFRSSSPTEKLQIPCQVTSSTKLNFKSYKLTYLKTLKSTKSCYWLKVLCNQTMLMPITMEDG